MSLQSFIFVNMRFKIFSVILFIVLSVIAKCEGLENMTSVSSTDNSTDNSFHFEDFDENNKVIGESFCRLAGQLTQSLKLDLNLNQNCSSHQDCTAKHSICDPSFNRCECDMTSMQTQFKCRTFYCQMIEECAMRFPESSCILGRCQCISGRKLNGKCTRGKGMGMGMGSGPLPDWAIISIAVTLTMTVIAGGSLRKAEVRSYLMRIIRMFLQKDKSSENSTSSEDNEDQDVSNKDIELSTVSTV